MNRVLIASILISAALSGCQTANTNTTPAQREEPVIQTIGSIKVPASEFSYVYSKNNANADDAFTEKSIREYLELYTNFKLKVADAEKAGLDTTRAFTQELEVYRKQLAQPYLTEKSVTEKLVKEAYERLKEEINAAHILITVAEGASPKDTLNAFNRINEIRTQALAGADFEELARTLSQDPSAKANSGNLGYFTALQMVYPFEQAAYITPVGQISPPIRTRFGYHIIKVKDRRPSQGQIKVAHIMVRANAGMPAEDSIAAKRKIDEIYSRIRKGESWRMLTAQFSDDNGSRAKGGELPAFGTGNMIPGFEEVAFALKTSGEVSKPVLTPYGWHVIKLIEKFPLAPFEQMEPTLKSKVSKDSRSELNRSALIARLKKENEFQENLKSIEAALAMADSSLSKGKWSYNLSDKNNKDVLFSIGENEYTKADFFNYVKGAQRPLKNTSADYLMRNMYQKFVEDNLVQYEEAHLEKKYEDYRMLVKEYRDGILLFQLMDNNVWTKAIEDTAGLRTFFNINRDKYTWGKRADAVVYSAADDKVLAEVKKKLNDKIFPVNEPAVNDVTFGKSSNKIEGNSLKVLDNLVAAMNNDQALYLDIIGHADLKETGGISGKRIGSVANYLIDKGISKERLVAKDYGTRLAVTAKSADNTKQKNQRVTFKVYSSSNKALEKVMNANAPLTLQVAEGLFQKGDNEFVDKVEWKEGEYTFESNGRIIYVVIKNVEEPRLKTLEESRGLAISDYQTYLEKEWIERLRKNYPVVINEAEVQKLIKN
jgi:peptidyl-prolyl cis-trans isomerase SurA